jgi:uncharacterized repeat protein (TIGR01451 family)
MRLLAGIGLLISGMCGLCERTEAEFAAAKSYTVGTGPAAVAIGDFNGDGKVDLVVVNAGSANVSVLLGNGDGTFQPAVNFDAGIKAPGDIAVGDFDGDGKLDVLVFTPGNAANSVAGAVSVFLGNGDGTFQAGKSTALSVYATQMGVADFNGDSKSDLVVSEFNTAFSISIYLGNGDGTFGAAKSVTDLAQCSGGVPVTGCRVFTTGDFNRDGKMDLAVGGTGGIQILSGNGDGSFRSGAAVAVAEGYTAFWLSTGDFNGDGIADLIVSSGQYSCALYNCSGTTHSSVLLGNGNGTFQSEKIFFTGSSSRNEIGFGGRIEIVDTLAGDFNGDGNLDIVDRYIAKKSPFPGALAVTTLQVRLGRGDGTFAPAIELPDAGIISAAGKFNGDSLTDLVAIGTSNNVDVILNDSPTSGADLVLTQTGASPEPVGVGQNLTYSTVVLNQGPENATGVKLSDLLPSGVTFVSATSTVGSCIAANNTVTCNIGALPKIASAQVAIVVTPTAAGTINNMLNVSGNETDGNAEDNSTSESSTVKAVYTLTVAKTGTGTGTVSAYAGVDRGINCGSVCTEKYLVGTIVSVNVSPDANSTFDGWSGACTGDSCSVTMNGDMAVTAAFARLPDFQVNPTAASLVMPRGGQSSEPVSFDAVGGFAGMIAVTCSVSGPAPMPTCSVTPSSVAAGGSVTLAVSGPKLNASMHRRGSTELVVASAASLPFGIAACLLGTGLDKKRRRKWLACLLVLLASELPAACGGGRNSKPVAENYMVTITGVSGSITHTVNVNVTVQ